MADHEVNPKAEPKAEPVFEPDDMDAMDLLDFDWDGEPLACPMDDPDCIFCEG